MGYSGVPEGVFNYQTGLILLSSYSLTHIRKQFYKKFLSLNPKYEEKKTYFFSYLGGPGGPLRRTQVNENFRAVRPHHIADICITREKNNRQFFIYEPLYTQICIFGYSGGPGWPINNRTGPILLPSYPLTIWKQSDKVFLSYRINDEMRTRRMPRTYFVWGIQLFRP